MHAVKSEEMKISPVIKKPFYPRSDVAIIQRQLAVCIWPKLVQYDVGL